MRPNRRNLLCCLGAGLVGAASLSGKAASPKARGLKSSPVEFAPFELQASTLALRQLTNGISGWRVERRGKMVSAVWLRTSDGTIWLLDVNQRDVRPMFEVFTLGMLSMSELRGRWERWKPPVLPAGVPDALRQLLTTRPAAPVAPTAFEAWPLRSWRTQVVRRTEFIVERADVGPTFGDNPNSQGAARPREVPRDASAFCEVAAGVLFTSEAYSVLLAVDWMPMNMLILQDLPDIQAFIADCELVDMADYLRRRSA